MRDRSNLVLCYKTHHGKILIPEWLYDWIDRERAKVYRSFMKTLNRDSSFISCSESVSRECDNIAYSLIRGWELGKLLESDYRDYSNGKFIVVTW
jgi:hypothetical protein